MAKFYWTRPTLRHITSVFVSDFQTNQTQLTFLWTHSSHLAKVVVQGVSFTITHIATQTCLSWVRGILMAVLTLAGVPGGFVAFETLALAHWHHPFTLSCAVDAWGGLTDGILYTGSLHLSESVCHRLREGRQALHCGRACLVVHSDWEQRHARSHVLKSQIEAFSWQRPHSPRLCVDLQHSALCDLIRSDGGHLAELPFTEVGSHIGISFWDEKVEGFFTGHRGATKGVAVPHNKTELYRDTCCPRTSLNECCA